MLSVKSLCQYLTLSVLVALSFNSIGNSQELPPLLTISEAIDPVCKKWNGKKLTHQSKTITVTRPHCQKIGMQMGDGLKVLLEGLTNEVRLKIRGDKTLSEVRRELRSEGMKCDETSSASDSFFNGLPYKFECLYSEGFTLKTQVYGNEDRMAGGVDFTADNIEGAVSIPSGKLGKFMSDLMSAISKAVVPGQSQLSITFKPASLSYKEYYLRRPLSTKSGKWVGYVIKVMDYGMLKGHEKRAKMIFPTERLYASERECYSKFEKVVSAEPLNSRYPQTSNAMTSYLFGCVEK